MNLPPRNLPQCPILVAGLVLAVASAVFAQSRERRSGRDRSSRNSSAYSLDSDNGPLPPSTGPGLTAESPHPGKPLPGDFEILAEKSIFERDRRPYHPPAPFEAPVIRHEDIAPPHIPAVPVLVGVIIGDDDSLIAYIEDPDAGKLYPLAVGDPLPLDYGNVQSIHLDGMEIGKDGGPEKQILIGQTLAGTTPDAPAFSEPTSSSSSSTSTPSTAASQPGAATGPALDPNAPGLSIEERMRLKRQQQLGQ